MNELGYSPESKELLTQPTFLEFCSFYDPKTRIIEYEKLPEIISVDDELDSRIRLMRKISEKEDTEASFPVRITGCGEVLKGDRGRAPWPENALSDRKLLGIFHSHPNKQSLFSSVDYGGFLKHPFSPIDSRIALSRELGSVPRWLLNLMVKIQTWKQQDYYQIAGLVTGEDIFMLTKTDLSEIPVVDSLEQNSENIMRLIEARRKANHGDNSWLKKDFNTDSLLLTELAKEYKLGAYYQGANQRDGYLHRLI